MNRLDPSWLPHLWERRCTQNQVYQTGAALGFTLDEIKNLLALEGLARAPTPGIWRHTNWRWWRKLADLHIIQSALVEMLERCNTG